MDGGREGKGQGCGSLTPGLDFPGQWSSDSSAPKSPRGLVKSLITAHPQCSGFRGAGSARGPTFLMSSQETVRKPLDRTQEKWGTRGFEPRPLPGPRLLSHELVTRAKLSTSKPQFPYL